MRSLGSHDTLDSDKSKEGFIDNVSKIAIIAGEGDLPLKIAERLGVMGQEYDIISISPGSDFSVGQVGKIMSRVHAIGADRVVFCGAVRRPSFFKLKLDKLGKEWLRKLGYRVFWGDASLLKGIKKLLLAEGIEVVSPQSILSTLLTPKGVLTITQPSDQDMIDIARGMFVLNAMSRADVGQAAVIQEGVVIALEAIEGTRNLILRSKDIKLSFKGGVLVKTSKIGQDQDIDLPTIGEETISECKESGLNGIALGAGITQIISFDDTIKKANKSGIFIIGV